MNNINRTAKDIKKKLSLNDYDKPARQQVNKPSKPHNTKSTSHYDDKPTTRKDASINNTPQNTKEFDHCNNKSTCQHSDLSTKENKIKATYYLTTEINNMFTDVYINRLKSNKKTDRSSLICEAIKYLYKNEF